MAAAGWGAKPTKPSCPKHHTLKYFGGFLWWVGRAQGGQSCLPGLKLTCEKGTSLGLEQHIFIKKVWVAGVKEPLLTLRNLVVAHSPGGGEESTASGLGPQSLTASHFFFHVWKNGNWLTSGEG